MIIPNKFNGYTLDMQQPKNWLPIAAAITALVGAAMQQQGAQKSARAVANAEAQSLKAQQARQAEINAKTLERAEAYVTDTRKTQQDAIKEDLTQRYTEAPKEATAINQESQTTQGDTSNDYAEAKARSNQRVLNNAEEFGRLMANVNSATRMRQLENIENAKAGNLASVQQALMRGDARLGQYNMEKASHAGDSLAGIGQIASLAGTAMGLGAMAGLGSTGLTTMTETAKQGMLNGASALGDTYGLGASLNLPTSLSSAPSVGTSVGTATSGLSNGAVSSLFGQVPTANPFAMQRRN